MIRLSFLMSMTIVSSCYAPKEMNLFIQTKPAPPSEKDKALCIKLYPFIKNDHYHTVRRTLLKQGKTIHHDILMKLLVTAVDNNAFKTASVLVHRYDLNPFIHSVMSSAAFNHREFTFLYYLSVWFSLDLFEES